MDVVVLELNRPRPRPPFPLLLQASSLNRLDMARSGPIFDFGGQSTLVDAVAGPAQRDVISAHAGPRILLVGRPGRLDDEDRIELQPLARWMVETITEPSRVPLGAGPRRSPDG